MPQKTVMPPQSRRARLVFVVRFAAGMLVLYAFVAFNAINDAVIVPFTAAVARVTALMLGGAQNGIFVAGTVIRSRLFALDVHNGCNGVEATILLIAAILAFPATLRSRLAGVAAATVAIELLNIVRLTSLFWLGEHHRAAFEFVHVAVWQSLIILAAIAMFLLWTLNFAKTPLADSR